MTWKGQGQGMKDEASDYCSLQVTFSLKNSYLVSK